MSGQRSTFRKYAGIAGAAVGVVAAGVVAERKLVAGRRSERDDELGTLRAPRRSVVADDGLELYVEVDELPDEPGSSSVDESDPVLVFVHGYALNLDSWHFQRAAMRGRHRAVFYDQRSHGRSGRSRPELCTFEQLGSDLARVVEEQAGPGPVVLVGHSMGGMTIMALAAQHPEWFGDRVRAVALISTSSGGMRDDGLAGLPGLPGRLLSRVAPAVVATLAKAPRLVESGRRAGADVGAALTRRLAFGGPVPHAYVDFTDEMLSATPFEVVADFFPAFELHRQHEALAALSTLPVTVICGLNDLITPIAHSRRIAQLLPSAQLVEFVEAGHMAILERHDEIDHELDKLIARAEEHL